MKIEIKWQELELKWSSKNGRKSLAMIEFCYNDRANLSSILNVIGECRDGFVFLAIVDCIKKRTVTAQNDQEQSNAV